MSQVLPPTHLSASPSRRRSHQAVDLGPTSAPSAMRTRWTPSSTPAGTCVCATPAASSSRRCPTHAVPSAEDRSKTLSKRTAARKTRLNQSQTPESGTQTPKFAQYELWFCKFDIFINLLSVGFPSWPFLMPASPHWKVLGHIRKLTLQQISGFSRRFYSVIYSCRSVFSWLQTRNTLKDRRKPKFFLNSFLNWAMF